MGAEPKLGRSAEEGGKGDRAGPEGGRFIKNGPGHLICTLVFPGFPDLYLCFVV